ncbi:hypothetical protein HPB49_006036 [Dermacentor silvarum]|uniref:Uncharacterized protein n=1 Tax=Dermacentor silvarum TaxID=543639 RepID=A0ACB8D3C9_DERSI|nr:hypothetical protein HPB49_006036 [Dermacentor silvarum]
MRRCGCTGRRCDGQSDAGSRDDATCFLRIVRSSAKESQEGTPVCLRDWLLAEVPRQKVKRFKEKRAYQYFMQMASALAYLHYKDIAHRDLKCENILFTSTNYVKLADFSFARYCSENAFVHLRRRRLNRLA